MATTGKTTKCRYTSDGRPYSVDFCAQKIKYERDAGGRTYYYVKTVPESPIGRLQLQWLAARGQGITSSTLANDIIASLNFATFVQQRQYSRVTAAIYRDYLRWLKDEGRSSDGESGLRETTRRRYSGSILTFCKWLYREAEELSRRELRYMKRAHTNVYRGFRERSRRRRQQYLLPGREGLRRLYRAIRMEIEEREERLTHSHVPDREIGAALALLPFCLLLGLDNAVRSGELNQLTNGDIEAIRGHIHLDQSDKEPADVVVSDATLRAWQMAKSWQELYRSDMDDPTAPALQYVSKTRGLLGGERILRLTSSRLQYHLLRFYEKYYEKREDDGKPVLFSEDEKTGERVPFNLPFGKYRHAAITEFVRQEPDLANLRQFARHKWLSTTVQHYVQNRPDEVRDAIVESLGPLTERVRIGVKSRLADEDQREAAEENGGVLPGGYCGKVLDGPANCQRSSDCRRCEHFLIDIRKKGWFIQDKERLLEKAARVEKKHGTVREKQNIMNLVALNNAIIEAIVEEKKRLA